ncbi:MAG: restriction endonuclease [Roseovarius sp.]|nr:restriction endonuclease [Roseovarius sp.]
MKRLGNLSPPDFEDLCRDILKAETGQRFSAFGAGADGGVNGRHSKGPKSTILQCKHYLNSTFSQLKSALKSAPRPPLPATLPSAARGICGGISRRTASDERRPYQAMPDAKRICRILGFKWTTRAFIIEPAEQAASQIRT